VRWRLAANLATFAVIYYTGEKCG